MKFWLKKRTERVGDFKSKNPDSIKNQDFTLLCIVFVTPTGLKPVTYRTGICRSIH